MKLSIILATLFLANCSLIDIKDSRHIKENTIQKLMVKSREIHKNHYIMAENVISSKKKSELPTDREISKTIDIIGADYAVVTAKSDCDGIMETKKIDGRFKYSYGFKKDFYCYQVVFFKKR